MCFTCIKVLTVSTFCKMPFCLHSQEGYSGFQVTGMIEWSQKSRPKKFPRASSKTQKIPGPKELCYRFFLIPPKKFLLKSSYPKKYLPNFRTQKKSRNRSSPSFEIPSAPMGHYQLQADGHLACRSAGTSNNHLFTQPLHNRRTLGYNTGLSLENKYQWKNLDTTRYKNRKLPHGKKRNVMYWEGESSHDQPLL